MRDDHAAIFEEHRSFLTALASRITGSWSDAPDLVSLAFTRWQKFALEDVENPRALLATIVSRLAINYSSSARMRHEIVLEPEAVNRLNEIPPQTLDGLADALGDAFEIVLSRLSPLERAIFLLREVFQFEYQELKDLFGETESNCRQILKRARDKITLKTPRFHVQAENCELALEKFLAASRHGSIEDLIDVIAPQVVLLRDPGDIGLPQPQPIYGADSLLQHVSSYWERHVDAAWSCYQIGRGYQIAIVTSGGAKAPLSAFICAFDRDSIKRVDHITCPTRLRMLLNLLGPGE